MPRRRSGRGRPASRRGFSEGVGATLAGKKSALAASGDGTQDPAQGEAAPMVPSSSYATVPCAVGRRRPLAFHEAGPPQPAKPRLLDRVRAAARLRHESRRTEPAYVAWIRRYIFFHGTRHPAELGALLFLYRDVLELDLPSLDGVVRAKRPERLPVVLTREEVAAVLRPLTGVPRLVASLLYGSGLRCHPAPGRGENRPACWRTAMTSVPCRNFSGTVTSARPRSTRMF